MLFKSLEILCLRKQKDFKEEASMAVVNTILDRLCGLEGSNFTVTDVKVFETQVTWRIEHKDDPKYICPRCEAVHNTAFEKKWIKLQDTPQGFKRHIWYVKRARVLCSCSLNPIVEKMDFRSKHHQMTKRFNDYIEMTLCSKMFTVADVARLFKLSYSVVYKIDHEVLLRLIQEHEIPDPIHLSVDETSFRKRRHYVTVVTDAGRGQVIWVSEGNRKESLDQFFRILGPERCAKVETVARDLHAPYASSCAEYVPHALQVADPFHVVQRLNDTIDECRKELSVGSALRVGKRRLIHRMNWLLRFKSENLRKDQFKSLEHLKRVNEDLYEAYLLKEHFYEFFEFKPSEINLAENFLVHWVVEAYKVQLASLKKFAEYITRNTDQLLNIIRTQRSSAISEGINSKISVIKKMAYGYKNIQYFMLKILQRCGALGRNWQPEPI
tara:strand:+ start:221 stop:1540 length:1320 start_codon:yes stop_codon:yes gene_type:complete